MNSRFGIDSSYCCCLVTSGAETHCRGSQVHQHFHDPSLCGLSGAALLQAPTPKNGAGERAVLAWLKKPSKDRRKDRQRWDFHPATRVNPTASATEALQGRLLRNTTLKSFSQIVLSKAFSIERPASARARQLHYGKARRVTVAVPLQIAFIPSRRPLGTPRAANTKRRIQNVKSLFARFLVLHLLSSSVVAVGVAANVCLSRRGIFLRLPPSIAAAGALHARWHAEALGRILPRSPWLQQLLLGPLLEELQFRLALPCLLLPAARYLTSAARLRRGWRAAGVLRRGKRQQGEKYERWEGQSKKGINRNLLHEGKARRRPPVTIFRCIHSTGIVCACSVLFGLAHHGAPLALSPEGAPPPSATTIACIRANRCLTATLQGLLWGLGPRIVLRDSVLEKKRALLPLMSLALHILNNVQGAVLLAALRRRRAAQHQLDLEKPVP
ncbi:uncharacterized protein LOC113146595 [Cyclospora cayetanensis]|uniref:Uncharacterized protein LOC113146595 n=1 Tax=Cyclospora cayetanensis TaxID=88456 RepID=A0A6P6RRS9_9EIME|nr:uncharacterized protein LOC113146595 [Cyclospora cayetanensis]